MNYITNLFEFEKLELGNRIQIGLLSNSEVVNVSVVNNFEFQKLQKSREKRLNLAERAREIVFQGKPNSLFLTGAEFFRSVFSLSLPLAKPLLKC